MSTSPILVMPLPRRRANGTIYTRREWLWVQAGKVCHWCRTPTRLSKDHAWDAATIDHVIPRYKGGSNEDDNVVSACNRCNNRRNHEDMTKLAEGSLLGNFKIGSLVPSPNAGKKYSGHNPPHVALTKDEKRAIMSRIPPMEDQRNQALKEIQRLNLEIKKLQTGVDLYRIVLTSKEAEIAKFQGMTVMGLIRSRIARWLMDRPTR